MQSFGPLAQRCKFRSRTPAVLLVFHMEGLSQDGIALIARLHGNCCVLIYHHQVLIIGT